MPSTGAVAAASTLRDGDMPAVRLDAARTPAASGWRPSCSGLVEDGDVVGCAVAARLGRLPAPVAPVENLLQHRPCAEGMDDARRVAMVTLPGLSLEHYTSARHGGLIPVRCLGPTAGGP